MSSDLLLIVGAGASYGCGDEVGGTCNVDFRPPLAAQLFEDSGRQLSVLEKYPRAAALRPQLLRRIKAGEPFEEVLRGFANSTSRQIRDMYQEVPFYMWNVLSQATESFSGGHGTHYDHLVQEIAARHKGPVAVMSTNYDRLFERALSRLTKISFDRLDDYWSGETGWTLTKPHGCISWGWPMSNAKIREPFALQVDGDTLQLGDVVVLPDGGRALLVGSQWYHPAIVPPEADKTTVACPYRQFEALRGAASRASKMVVIGFSGLDAHLLPSLRPANGVRYLLIANGSMDEGRKTLGRLHTHVWGHSRFIAEDVVFDGGFADLMASDRLAFLGVE